MNTMIALMLMSTILPLCAGNSASSAKQSDLKAQCIAAIIHNNVDEARRLIEAGADFSTIGKPDAFPLYGPCQKGQTEMIKLLIDHGASVNAQGFNKVTPLMIAAASNQPEAIKLLIKNGANIHAIDFKGDTALHLACQRKCPDTAHALLEHGADMHMPNIRGYTPLLCAFSNNQLYDKKIINRFIAIMRKHICPESM